MCVGVTLDSFRCNNIIFPYIRTESNYFNYGIIRSNKSNNYVSAAAVILYVLRHNMNLFCVTIRFETLNHAFMVITNFGYGLGYVEGGFQVYYECWGINGRSSMSEDALIYDRARMGPPNCVYCAWRVLRFVRDDADIGMLRVIWVSVIRWMFIKKKKHTNTHIIHSLATAS